MKIMFQFICVVVSIASCTGVQDSKSEQKIQDASHILNGSWKLKIENLQHEVITTLVIRFLLEQADSCIGGNWKKLVVDSHKTLDEKFFPVTEPLSYEFKNNKLLIGHNQLCDAYLHLKGEIRDFKANGEYVTFGWGSKKLGYFLLTQSVK